MWRHLAIVQLVGLWTVEVWQRNQSVAGTIMARETILYLLSGSHIWWPTLVIFNVPSVNPLLAYLICRLDIKSCLYLGLFLNSHVHWFIVQYWIILQSDVIDVEYILFQQTIIRSWYTIEGSWIVSFKYISN